MSENLKKCIPLLFFIADIKDKNLQKSVLKYYSRYRKISFALREICRNIIKGNIKLNKHKKSKISKYKSNIYKLASSKHSNKKHIQQVGGWSWLFPMISGILNI